MNYLQNKCGYCVMHALVDIILYLFINNQQMLANAKTKVLSLSPWKWATFTHTDVIIYLQVYMYGSLLKRKQQQQ